jgi:hypothetical protein
MLYYLDNITRYPLERGDQFFLQKRVKVHERLEFLLLIVIDRSGTHRLASLIHIVTNIEDSQARDHKDGNADHVHEPNGRVGDTLLILQLLNDVVSRGSVRQDHDGENEFSTEFYHTVSHLSRSGRL